MVDRCDVSERAELCLRLSGMGASSLREGAGLSHADPSSPSVTVGAHSFEAWMSPSRSCRQRLRNDSDGAFRVRRRSDRRPGHAGLRYP
jgi:hypothetical protein